ncbi:MAG: Maf family protein [Acidobacteriaceae bacterium]|jgi:septum formation protein
MNGTLILASASPRRRELLTQAGYRFQVEASSVAESRRPGEDAIRFATRLAREKAEEVFARHQSSAERVTVLGADTVVVCDGEVMGKPADAAEATRMLLLLSGRTHQVVTGVAVVWAPGSAEVAAELTQVTMRTLSPQEVSDYVAGGEPMDKAGAYAIQGYAGRWIPRISGCYFNVVGLPLALVTSLLEGAQQRMTVG